MRMRNGDETDQLGRMAGLEWLWFVFGGLRLPDGRKGCGVRGVCVCVCVCVRVRVCVCSIVTCI